MTLVHLVERAKRRVAQLRRMEWKARINARVRPKEQAGHLSALAGLADRQKPALARAHLRIGHLSAQSDPVGCQKLLLARAHPKGPAERLDVQIERAGRQKLLLVRVHPKGLAERLSVAVRQVERQIRLLVCARLEARPKCLVAHDHLEKL